MKKIMLGLALVAILTLSVGAVNAIAGERGSGGGMMSGWTAHHGGMMSAQGGMMGAFGNLMNGYASIMSSSESMVGRHGGMMSQMVQHMAGFWNQTHKGSETERFLAILAYAFYPSNITVPQGTTVTWVNMNFVQHTVTSGTEPAPTGLFDSNALSHMQSFSYTFNTPGIYSYFCDLHPNMLGTIRVTG